MTQNNNEGLWDYAVSLYTHEPIKIKCLELQESSCANVNIILWLCWLDHHRIVLTKSALQQVIDTVEPVDVAFVSALRRLRRSLRESEQFTRVQKQLILKHMAAAELAIERVLLLRLQDMTQRLPAVNEDGEHGLSLFDYFDWLQVEASDKEAAFFLDTARPLFQPGLDTLIAENVSAS